MANFITRSALIRLVTGTEDRNNERVCKNPSVYTEDLFFVFRYPLNDKGGVNDEEDN